MGNVLVIVAGLMIIIISTLRRYILLHNHNSLKNKKGLKKQNN